MIVRENGSYIGVLSYSTNMTVTGWVSDVKDNERNRLFITHPYHGNLISVLHLPPSGSNLDAVHWGLRTWGLGFRA